VEEADTVGYPYRSTDQELKLNDVNNFKVSGFKAINNEKEFSFAPITLLIGPNGSGKSTVIKALKSAKSIFYQKPDNVGDITPYSQTKYNVWLKRSIMDSIKDASGVVNRNATQANFTLSFPFSLAYFPDEFNLKLTYFYQGDKFLLMDIAIQNVRLKTSLFSVKTVASDKSNRNYSTVKIDYAYLTEFLETELKELPEKKEFSLKDMIRNPSEGEMEDLAKQLHTEAREPVLDFDKVDKCELNRQEKHRKFDFHLEKLMRKTPLDNYFDFSRMDESITPDLASIKDDLLKRLRDFSKEGWSSHHSASYTAAEIFESLLEDSFKGISINSVITKTDLYGLSVHEGNKLQFINEVLIEQNIQFALRNLHQDVHDITYIPPNRYRTYDSEMTVQQYGELSLDLLNKIQTVKIEEWWEEPIDKFISFWLKEFDVSTKFGRQALIDALALIEKNAFQTDLGFGLNQLLPLILYSSIFNAKGMPVSGQGASAEYNDSIEKSRLRQLPGYTFLIEEPEANLHPNFQSRLADLFIDAAWKFNHNFIIETHSEYMVRKFQYWVAKGKIRPEDVKLYYFANKNNDETVMDVAIKEIKILRNGDLSEPFGDGFYDEAINLQYDLLKIKKTQQN
jgi:AAA15 family ATPase/GTPase